MFDGGNFGILNIWHERMKLHRGNHNFWAQRTLKPPITKFHASYQINWCFLLLGTVNPNSRERFNLSKSTHWTPNHMFNYQYHWYCCIYSNFMDGNIVLWWPSWNFSIMARTAKVTSCFPQFLDSVYSQTPYGKFSYFLPDYLMFFVTGNCESQQSRKI